MLRPGLSATVLLLVGACSCGPEEPPLPEGQALLLLARRPDSISEQPGAIRPRGDVPGTVSWGIHDGPGWSAKDHQLDDGTHYRETNQPVAGLVLPATRPCDRELVLRLWCARPAGAEPSKVIVSINGVAVTHELVLAREPSDVRLKVPQPFWGLDAGDNQLELEVPVQELDGRPAWDVLGLAEASYGPEARVALDPGARTARLADGTGLRYELELTGDAVLRFAGTATGGTLRLRTGQRERARGTLGRDGEAWHEFPARGGRIEGELPLARRSDALRVLELEWFAPGGEALVLERLDAVERAPRARPPIVLVSIDTFAARHLSLYGYGRPTSPALEALQHDAVVFERAQTNAPWTMPSYLALLTGLYPRAHLMTVAEMAGAEIDNFSRWQVADNRWTLAEALRGRGYRTGAFVDTQWLTGLFGFEQGFDTYDGQGALAPFSDPKAHIQRIVRELVPSWLAAGAADVPPFLFLHALDAHGPYLPDAPFRDRFAGVLDGAEERTPAGSLNQTYRAIPVWMARTEVPEETSALPPELPLAHVVARYDESVLKVDSFLGELVALLKQRGLYDECALIVTADHGEAFGPGVYGHGVMREEVLHVPLVLKLPHGAHAGRRVQTPVQLVDLYPTLLELAGAEPRPAELHGTSLLQVLAAPADERLRYSEAAWVESYSITQGRWKLVEEYPGSESAEQSLLTHPRVPEAWLRQNFPEVLERPLSEELLRELAARPGYAERLQELRALVAGPYRELYDLEADPAGGSDVAAQHPEVVERLRPLLEAERARSRRAKEDADPDFHRQVLGAEQRDRLEGLGYGGEK